MSKKLVSVGFIMGMFFVYVGCGGDDDVVATASASCELPAMATIYDMCHDFKDWPSSGLSTPNSDCEGGTWGAVGTWSEGTACATEGSLGTCTWTAGGRQIVTVYTAATGETANTSKIQCEGANGWQGTWADAS